MRKPYFYFHYGKKRTVRINNRHGRALVAFARRLPGFLVDRSPARLNSLHRR